MTNKVIEFTREDFYLAMIDILYKAELQYVEEEKFEKADLCLKLQEKFIDQFIDNE